MTLKDIYGPQDAFLDELAVQAAPLPTPVRDTFAEDQALLGSSRSGDFIAGIGQNPDSASVGGSAFDVATIVAQDSITANEIAAGSITVGSLSQNAQNEATNGSFENLNGAAGAVDTFGATPFVGWTDDGSLQYGYNTSNPHGGGRCAIIKYGLVTRTLSSEPSQVVGGRKYRLSYWYRGTGGNNAAAKGQVKFVEYNLAGGIVTTTTGTLHTVGSTTTWAQATLTVTLGAATVKGQIQLIVSASATGDVVAFDDVELYPMDYDVNHAAGSVLIDSTGLTINNGKLTINDVGGTVVMTASGFAGPWDDYIVSGVYNNTFQSAPLGFLAAAADIPYWTFARTGNANAVKIEVQSSTATPSGRKLVFSLTGTSGSSSDEVSLSQLAPLTPPSAANAVVPVTVIEVPWVQANGGGTGSLNNMRHFIQGAFFKGDGVTQTGATFENFVTSSPSSTGPHRLTLRTPSDAGFIFVKFGIRRHTASTSGATTSTVYSASIRRGRDLIEIGTQNTGDDGIWSGIQSTGASGGVMIVAQQYDNNIDGAGQLWTFGDDGLTTGPHGPIQAIQSGVAALVFSASSQATLSVTFPRDFYPTIPNVVATPATNSVSYGVSIDAQWTDRFTIKAFTYTGGSVSLTINVHWIATVP